MTDVYGPNMSISKEEAEAMHSIMSITHCQIDRQSDTCTQHEHENLDTFITKVEASGEDKKHAPFGYVTKGVAEKVPTGAAWIVGGTTRLRDDDVAIYTQAQRDAYAAEAVKQERERWISVCTSVADEGWQARANASVDDRSYHAGQISAARAIEAAIRKDQP